MEENQVENVPNVPNLFNMADDELPEDFEELVELILKVVRDALRATGLTKEYVLIFELMRFLLRMRCAGGPDIYPGTRTFENLMNSLMDLPNDVKKTKGAEIQYRLIRYIFELSQQYPDFDLRNPNNEQFDVQGMDTPWLNFLSSFVPILVGHQFDDRVVAPPHLRTAKRLPEAETLYHLPQEKYKCIKWWTENEVFTWIQMFITEEEHLDLLWEKHYDGEQLFELLESVSLYQEQGVPFGLYIKLKSHMNRLFNDMLGYIYEEDD